MRSLLPHLKKTPQDTHTAPAPRLSSLTNRDAGEQQTNKRKNTTRNSNFNDARKKSQTETRLVKKIKKQAEFLRDRAVVKREAGLISRAERN